MCIDQISLVQLNNFPKSLQQHTLNPPLTARLFSLSPHFLLPRQNCWPPHLSGVAASASFFRPFSDPPPQLNLIIPNFENPKSKENISSSLSNFIACKPRRRYCYCCVTGAASVHLMTYCRRRSFRGPARVPTR